jgi:SnoaL-like domain
MLDDAELVRQLERHWEYSGRDEDISHEIYHEDAVLEFPQSGERFDGVANFREWRRQYPAWLQFHIRRITHRGDLVVCENLISYDGAPWMFTVNLLEFRDDKVAHERIYIMEPWDPAQWRAPWRSDTTADGPIPAPESRPTPA